MAVVVAEGVVELTADGKPIVREVDTQLGKASDIAEKKGDEGGKRFGDGFGGAVGALGLGAVIGGAIGVGINQGLDIDSSSRLITAQLDLTAEESGRIGNVAGTLFSQAYGDSIEDVNGAVGNVVSSIGGMRDASEEALSAMTAKALNFSTAFEVDTARSTQVVGQMLSAGLVESADEGFDLLTAALQRVPAAVREDVLDAADEYGPFFRNIGLDGEAAMSALVAASDKGMYGIDKTGDAVKEFGIRATDMSAASKVGFDLLGLSQEEMASKLLAGGDTAAGAFDQIVGGLRGMTDPVAQSQAALALFGTPLEDLSVTEIPNFLASLQGVNGGLGEVEGAADKMGDTLGGSTKNSWTELSREFMSIVGTVGQSLLPALVGVMSFLGDNPTVLYAVAGALGFLAVAFGAVTIATWAMNTALLANPLTWIILGIGALVAAVIWLVANWETVWPAMVAVFEGFVGWISGVINGFIGWWNDVWTGFGMWFAQTWSNLKLGAEIAWNMLVSWLIGAALSLGVWWNGFWRGVGDFFVGIWNWLITTATSIFSGIVSGAMSIGTTFAGWWNGFWNGVGSFFARIWGDFVTGAQIRFQQIVSFAQSILSGFTSLWSNLWNGARLLAQGAIQAIVGAAQGLANSVGGAIQGVVNFFGGIRGEVLDKLSGAGQWLVSTGRNMIEGLIQGVQSVAGRIAETVLAPIRNSVEGVKNFLGIASPSRLLRNEVGRMMPAGIELGITDGMPSLTRSIEEMVSVPDVAVRASSLPSYATSGLAQEGATMAAIRELLAQLATRATGASGAINLTQNITSEDPVLGSRQAVREITRYMKAS